MRKLRRCGKHLAVVAMAAAVMPGYSGLASLLGESLYPANHPWNQNILNAPVATNSTAIINHIGTNVAVHPDWGADSPANGSSPLYGIPYNVVHGNSTAKIAVIIDDYASESDIVPVPIPANAVIEGDYQNGPNTNGPGYNTNQRGDSHLIVWDVDSNIGYELYEATRPSDTNLCDGTPHTDGQWHAVQETVWNFNSNNFRHLGYTSADAAGLSILAGLARPDEGLTVAQGGQGVINHALRMTLPASIVDSQYIYPASHKVNASSGSSTIPLGGRLRLKNTLAVNTLISNMPPQSQIVARAMQQYGLIVADIGSAMYVTGASASVDTANNISLVWNQSDIFASTGLKALHAGDFEVANLTPVMTSLSATNGSPGSNLTLNGLNFSGAAGHVSVFFGNANAGSVNVLSDSQISVTVPQGSGTADVTVQSGLNDLDTYSSSTNANINTPIFGYGTCAVTTADKFTFLPPSPTLEHFTLSAGKLITTWTNNNGPGGTFHLLTSTNLLLPRTNWMVLTNGSFDSHGNASFTNTLGTNFLQYYSLEVP